jgi:hypothetical protein
MNISFFFHIFKYTQLFDKAVTSGVELIIKDKMNRRKREKNHEFN